MPNLSAEVARSLDNGVVISATYDSRTFSVRGFTITCAAGRSATATVTKDGTAGTWSLVGLPGQSVSDTLPANLVAFPDDGTGAPAIPFSTLSTPVWYGEFGVWRWVVT